LARLPGLASLPSPSLTPNYRGKEDEGAVERGRMSLREGLWEGRFAGVFAQNICIRVL